MNDEEKGEVPTSNRRSKSRAPKPPNPTWADAAKKVLSSIGHNGRRMVDSLFPRNVGFSQIGQIVL